MHAGLAVRPPGQAMPQPPQFPRSAYGVGLAAVRRDAVAVAEARPARDVAAAGRLAAVARVAVAVGPARRRTCTLHTRRRAGRGVRGRGAGVAAGAAVRRRRREVGLAAVRGSPSQSPKPRCRRRCWQAPPRTRALPFACEHALPQAPQFRDTREEVRLAAVVDAAVAVAVPRVARGDGAGARRCTRACRWARRTRYRTGRTRRPLETPSSTAPLQSLSLQSQSSRRPGGRRRSCRRSRRRGRPART